jgi:hypothetical protein
MPLGERHNPYGESEDEGELWEAEGWTSKVTRLRQSSVKER